MHPKFIARFLVKHAVTRLNIAGKRESGAPGIGAVVHAALSVALAVPGE